MSELAPGRVRIFSTTHEEENREYVCFAFEAASQKRFYPHRIAGGDRHHRDSRRDAAAGTGQGQAAGTGRLLHEQPPAIVNSLAHVCR